MVIKTAQTSPTNVAALTHLTYVRYPRPPSIPPACRLCDGRVEVRVGCHTRHDAMHASLATP
ncbi:hypothetical protein XAR_3191 [Xanthomonas citri pv. glycines str. 8ra]|nr:hypothetical protein XAR_3191 [Xanthomonas citri pv. glycines str. 8ra]